MSQAGIGGRTFECGGARAFGNPGEAGRTYERSKASAAGAARVAGGSPECHS